MAAPSDLFDPRREARRPMALAAELVASEWECHAIELVEISAGGFRARHSGQVAAHERIRVGIPALGAFDARVKWVYGPFFGAEFCSPADLRLLFLSGPLPRRETWLERRAA